MTRTAANPYIPVLCPVVSGTESSTAATWYRTRTRYGATSMSTCLPVRLLSCRIPPQRRRVPAGPLPVVRVLTGNHSDRQRKICPPPRECRVPTRQLLPASRRDSDKTSRVCKVRNSALGLAAALPPTAEAHRNASSSQKLKSAATPRPVVLNVHHRHLIIDR